MVLSDALLGFLKRIEFITKTRFMIFDYILNTYLIFGKHEVKKKVGNWIACLYCAVGLNLFSGYSCFIVKPLNVFNIYLLLKNKNTTEFIDRAIRGCHFCILCCLRLTNVQFIFISFNFVQ